MCAILVVSYGGWRVYRHVFPRHAPPPPVRPEVTLTIIPGWNLRQVEGYLIEKGFAKEPFLSDIMVAPAVDISLTRSLPAGILTDRYNPPYPVLKDKPWSVSYEGYLAPETYRVFADASIKDIFLKFIAERNREIQTIDATDTSAGIEKKNWHEILTMASLVEREAKTPIDRQKVADILWRRVKRGMALQLDSTVHYAIDKSGTVFTTGKEREVDSLWNTYKYPGLPPGPICNPSIESIQAVLKPFSNSDWYFLSGRDGTMHYAKTLEEHAANKKYL